VASGLGGLGGGVSLGIVSGCGGEDSDMTVAVVVVFKVEQLKSSSAKSDIFVIVAFLGTSRSRAYSIQKQDKNVYSVL
jgi:hypothetical protein